MPRRWAEGSSTCKETQSCCRRFRGYRRCKQEAFMTATSPRVCNFGSAAFLVLCSLSGVTTQLDAQLWEVPPLPPVTAVKTADGMTAKVGSETLHVSVCRASAIHFH